MSSKQATPPFPPATEEEEAMGQDDVGWANEDRESQDQPASPTLHSKSLPEEHQPIRDSQPESAWKSIGSTQTVRHTHTHTLHQIDTVTDPHYRGIFLFKTNASWNSFKDIFRCLC